MRDLAPDIIRQRMVIEGTLTRPFAGERMTSYCEEITKVLDMTPVTSPMCNYDSHYGWCAYMHWKESGIHIYSWEKHEPAFFSIDIYTCKSFREEDVAEFTEKFFNYELIELVWKD
jgi:S-adenosylmethionine decarboxylase